MINTGKVLIIRDELEIKQAIKVNDILYAISEFDQWLRSEGKYHGREYETDEDDPESLGFKKTVRDKLREYLGEQMVSLDELYP